MTVIALALAAMNSPLDVGAPAERSAKDADAYAKVEQAQHYHGNDEKNKGGHFIERPLGRSIFIQHGAKGRFWNQVTTPAWILNIRVDDPRVNGER